MLVSAFRTLPRVFRAAAAASLTILAASPARAQFTITVPTANIANGKVGACKSEGEPPLPTTPKTDKTNLKFKFSGADKTPAAVIVQIDGAGVGAIPEGSATDFVLPVPVDKLENGVVSIAREDAGSPICSLVPWVTPRSFVAKGPNYTSFVADGAIGKALRGGPSSDVTGSLGIDHRSEQTIGWALPAGKVHRFFHPLEFWRSKGEELHAVLTVASSSDSLIGTPENFGSAILAPNLSGGGSLQGATIEYHSFNPLNKSGGTWGPRIKTTFARSMWRVVDTTSAAAAPVKADTLREAVPLMALDAGFRFSFLNHLVDEKQNTFAVGLDLNYVLRFAYPNSDLDKRIIGKALKSGNYRAMGIGTAFWIRLRQVTATADIPYLWHPKGGAIQGLTGLQPTVTMRFSSALFTI